MSGQGWEIPICAQREQAMNPDAQTFEAVVRRQTTSKLFGRAVEGMDVEIIVWAVNATTPPEARWNSVDDGQMHGSCSW